MKRKSYARMACPIARTLEHVGDWWNILILRDAIYGLKRFDHFQKALGIGTAMLTRRLNQLVKAGFLVKRRYSKHPPRYEYVLTDRGREFRQVLLSFVQFGNRHFAPEGESLTVADRETSRPVVSRFHDSASGQEIPSHNVGVIAGPQATQSTKARLALAAGEITADDFVLGLSTQHRPSSRKAARARAS